ncbi:differential expressed balu-42 [Penicillium taxi]|uniref:differential expressed balu-42 n=1 Tax=Penicillium taxi TaxID=168475 RepID=UPI0025457611|nr:differential expressed balu-42 [Penicillium taxi]KAJ5894092.1 differential expressed balu-42 [Penicillium taxi]
MHFSAAVVSTFAALAAAYTTPDYSKDPSGNAIYTPTLGELVPEGKAFDITWDPTLGDKVSLVLLRGPSSNVVPLETIVEDIDNTGSYTWTPSTSLETDTTHYGILLVVEGTGAYQWSVQFGISNEDGTVDSTSTAVSSVAASTTAASTTASPSATGETYVTVIDNVTTTICPVAESASAASTSAAAVTSAAVSYSTVIPTWVETTTICPNSKCGAATAAPVVSPSSIPSQYTLVSSAAAVSSTPLTAPSATSTPVFNGAGRNAISFGAIVAALAAVMFI